MAPRRFGGAGCHRRQPAPQPLEEAMSNEFTCYLCKGTFEKGWTDEESEAEFSVLFPDTTRSDDDELVCDVCFEKMKVVLPLPLYRH